MADKEKSSRSRAGMGGGSKKSSSKSGRHPHETHIRHFKNGGHVVTHHYKNEDGGMEPGEPDVMADKAALMSHLQDSIPDNGPAQAGPPEAAAAGPAAGPGPTAAGPAAAAPGPPVGA
jgi:hypothetical protein